MKKMIKSLSVLVFLFVLSFVLVSTVSADAPVITAADGASLRTTGENQGIKFTATLDTLEGVTEHGFLVAKGAYSLEEMKNGANAKQQKVVLTGTNKTFNLVIFGLDSAEDYLADLTVVAYAVYEEEAIYAEAVTRNMAEVALDAKAEGNTSTLVTDVIDGVASEYKLVSKEANYVSISSSYVVEDLEAEFVKDFNAVMGTSLSTDATEKTFFLTVTDCPSGSYSTGKSGNTNISGNPIFKFFKNEKMNAKWSFLVEYIMSVGTNNPHIGNQGKALLNAVTFDGVKTSDYTYAFFYLEHMVFSIYNFFNESDKVCWFHPVYWSSTNNGTRTFSAYPFEGQLTANLDDYDLVKVGDAITLPAAIEKTGYTFNGWTDGAYTYDAGAEYTVTVDAQIVPSLTATEYSIKYYNGATEYTELADTYTIEDAITLPTLENVPGSTFVGWYTNPEFDGDVVTKVAAGSTEEQVFYARWIAGYSEVVVNAAWATEAEGAKVTFDGKEYTVGSDAQATIANALLYVQEEGTIYVAAGTYAEKLTIAKDNLTIAGPNKGVNAAKDTRATEAVLSGLITIAANVKNITIDGFQLTGSGAVALSAGVSDFALQYCVLGTHTSDGIVYGPASGEVANVKANYNYSSSYSSNRFVRFPAIINGLELIGNDITVSSCYDFLNVGSKLKGVVVIANNRFTKGLQSFIYVKGVGVLDCDIYGNYVSNIANAIIDMRNMGENGAVVVDIYENEFDNGKELGWMPIRVRTAGYDSNDTIEVNVYDNKFIDAYTTQNDTYCFVENPSRTSQVDPFKVIYTIGKNYYEVGGVAVTSVTEDSFDYAAISFEQPYQTSEME